jgi:hypothetical protein
MPRNSEGNPVDTAVSIPKQPRSLGWQTTSKRCKMALCYYDCRDDFPRIFWNGTGLSVNSALYSFESSASEVIHC